jgi:Flp pilus assembly protein TadG
MRLCGHSGEVTKGKRSGIDSTPRVRAVRDDEGSVLAEFSIGVLVLMILILSVADFGRMLYSYQFVSGAARQATRWASVRGSSCTTFSTACPASATDIQNYVRSLAPGGIDPARITVTAKCGTPGNPPPTGGCTSPDNDPGKAVNIRVQYSFSFVYGFVGTAQTTLSSSSQLVISQ